MCGHGWCLGMGYLVVRYNIKIRKDMFELKSAYIVNVLINVKLRHTCLKFVRLVYFC